MHPLRSDPALAAGLGLGAHAVAIAAAMVLTVTMGLAVGFLGLALRPLSEAIGGALAAAGMILAFSVMLSWVGHLPGAVLLQVFLRNGLGGWLTVLLGGVALGGLFSALIGGPLPVLIAPILAVLHAVCLRWLAIRGLRRSGDSRRSADSDR
ncbi:hypothetical protein KUW09_19925 [Mameliella alba]|nr:hypothetical protein [Antarctobacter heliothermus]MBY6146330.1 hypothetical protein [Mameliella alba]MCA0955729.1 hypothetical protein [Mameliella alba]